MASLVEAETWSSFTPPLPAAQRISLLLTGVSRGDGSPHPGHAAQPTEGGGSASVPPKKRKLSTGGSGGRDGKAGSGRSGGDGGDAEGKAERGATKTPLGKSDPKGASSGKKSGKSSAGKGSAGGKKGGSTSGGDAPAGSEAKASGAKKRERASGASSAPSRSTPALRKVHMPRL